MQPQNNAFLPADNKHPKDKCQKAGVQYAEISLPIQLRPDSSVKEVETFCCGEPVITCEKKPDEHTCSVIITQKICVRIPVDFGVKACVGQEKIKCKCKEPPCDKDIIE